MVIIAVVNNYLRSLGSSRCVGGMIKQELWVYKCLKIAPQVCKSLISLAF